MLSNLKVSAAFAIAALVALIIFGLAPASAHPHVFVTVQITVVIDKGTVTGFQHVWTFDEFYSAMAVEGLDKKQKGVYSREELSELAKVNMEGLKEFNYFTHATLAGKPLQAGDPKPADYWLEHKADVLSLNFFLPLAQPVLVDAKDFAFSIYDSSYFIAFDLAKDDPVRLSEGAPKGCSLKIGTPQPEGSDGKRLNEAFAGQLGGAPVDSGVAKTITLACAG